MAGDSEPQEAPPEEQKSVKSTESLLENENGLEDEEEEGEMEALYPKKGKKSSTKSSSNKKSKSKKASSSDEDTDSDSEEEDDPDDPAEVKKERKHRRGVTWAMVGVGYASALISIAGLSSAIETENAKAEPAEGWITTYTIGLVLAIVYLGLMTTFIVFKFLKKRRRAKEAKKSSKKKKKK